MKLLLLGILFGFSSPTFSQRPAIGEQIKEIEMVSIKGSKEKISDLRGKVVLIDFWASWCGPCRQANKGLVSLYAKYKNKGFEIFGISIDEDLAAWKKAVAKDRINWKQVNEDGGWDGSLTVTWKIEEIPSSFLLDKDGRVVAIDPTHREIEAYLKKTAK